MRGLVPFLLALTACNLVDERAEDKRSKDAVRSSLVAPQTSSQGANRPTASGERLPAKYVKAFMCDFDENPIAAASRVHGTSRGRAERASDLVALRALGFGRETRDGDLSSVGGKVAAPPGLTILGLPVRSLEINGMIGDVNALFVTTFADGVTVAQVVKAARLSLDQLSYKRYGMRHYSRTIGNSPHIAAYLDDRGGGNALFSCQVQSTPD